MNAEIITIGTELLLGVTVDTNSAYLMQQLATVGVPVRRVTLVRDDTDEIVSVIQAAMERVQLVICVGGLGPTDDDLTREAIARATGKPLEFHQALLDDIARVDFFASVPRVEVPVYFFHGVHDQAVPLSVMQRYFERLDAPQGKQLTLLENSAHITSPEDVEKIEASLAELAQR